MCFKREKPSPQDIVKKEWIPTSIYTSQINIPFTDDPLVYIPDIADTNSMDPLFDIGHNCILLAGATEADQATLCDFLKVGDVAVYQVYTNLIIHRITKIGSDDTGRFFKFKGDNNFSGDHYKVRDSWIRYLMIGVIY